MNVQLVAVMVVVGCGVILIQMYTADVGSLKQSPKYGNNNKLLYIPT